MLVVVLAVRMRERVSEPLVVRDDRSAVTVRVVVGMKREVKVRQDLDANEPRDDRHDGDMAAASPHDWMYDRRPGSDRSASESAN